MHPYTVVRDLLTPVTADIDDFKGNIYEYPIIKSPTEFDHWMRNEVFSELMQADRDHHRATDAGDGPPDDNFLMTIAHVHLIGSEILKANVKTEVIEANSEPTFDTDRRSIRYPWRLYHITNVLGVPADKSIICAYHIAKK